MRGLAVLSEAGFDVFRQKSGGERTVEGLAVLSEAGFDVFRQKSGGERTVEGLAVLSAGLFVVFLPRVPVLPVTRCILFIWKAIAPRTISIHCWIGCL